MIGDPALIRQELLDAASAAGLTIAWVVPRERAERGFAGKPGVVTPAQLHPGYRSAIVLGSGGPAFWRRFREAAPGEPAVAADPLDRFTESAVEPLVEPLRRHDPAVVAVYPFRHARQLLPFAGLLDGIAAFRTAPFGVLIDPRHGPWFAWRAAILTTLEFPARVPEGAGPCAACAAPCVTACPAAAVDKTGFRWRDCVAHRLAAEDCRERCLAREACPAGAEFRYPPDEIRYHYRASLRMIRQSQPPSGTRA